jgi:hypothetical protein
MARWQLIEPHYLIVLDKDGECATKWEYIETDRTTGRQKRKQYDVPQYFHHEDESCWTEFTANGRGEKLDGMVVVSDGHNANPRDIIFQGEPTPGMKAIDDEAREISAKFGKIRNWNQPDRMFSEYEGTYAQRMMDDFVQTQGKVNMQLATATEQGALGVGKALEGITKILEQMALKDIAKQEGLRPVVDNMEPLASPEGPDRPVAAPPLLRDKRRDNLAKARAVRLERLAKARAARAEAAARP